MILRNSTSIKTTPRLALGLIGILAHFQPCCSLFSQVSVLCFGRSSSNRISLRLAAGISWKLIGYDSTGIYFRSSLQQKLQPKEIAITSQLTAPTIDETTNCHIVRRLPDRNPFSS
ncbi:hypothetical protein BDV29DRAFT_56172 [Aspergillus leporis]|uniref:Uncharacterized protein n=1 Tax=Aspergillus leporis TaxID=41062 RepID=A0A5N5WLW7_9EURO|nr:hypothetical protein BDV29DRAFT_56172 [Aspergillus leporis]